MPLTLVKPNWPVPDAVQSFATTRSGGASSEPWDSFNLGLHVGDIDSNVQYNRSLLAKETGLPNPKWLQQTHSTELVAHKEPLAKADGCFTSEYRKACLVMMADCLPVLLSNQAGGWVAAVHAGWKGLTNGILYKAVECYQGRSKLLAWIGPAISQECFEVGGDVYSYFIYKNSELKNYFNAISSNKWLADLAGIAQYQLERAGVEVYQSGLCTYKNQHQFFSHRRATHEQAGDVKTGRMVTAIWIDNETNKEG